jgi:uncharacterized lipoprotein
MKRTYQLLTFTFLSALATGCSYFPDRSTEYQESTYSSRLTVPPNFSNAQLGDDFAIPDSNQTVCKCSLVPPESLVSEIADGKLTAKELKKQELQSRAANIEWTQTKSGSEALMSNEALPDTWNHLDRALEKLAAKYRIKSKNKAFATFSIYDLSATHGKVKATTPLYEIHLSENENGTLIVLTKYGIGNTPSPEINQRILEKLYQSLDETKEGLSFKQWLGW